MIKRTKNTNAAPITIDGVVLVIGVIGLCVAVLMSISTGVVSLSQPPSTADTSSGTVQQNALSLN